MKRTGMNLENFREKKKKKKKNCIERDSNPSILAYKQSYQPTTPTLPAHQTLPFFTHLYR